MNQLLQQPGGILDKQGVDMIWHDDETDHRDPDPIKVTECFRDDLRTILPPKETATMTRVQPGLDGSRKPFMVLAFNLGGPGRWMIL